MAKEEPHSHPSKHNLTYPRSGVGIDLGDNILQALVEEWHVEDIPGLWQ